MEQPTERKLNNATPRPLADRTPELVDTAGAARILRTKPGTLVVWRYTKKHPLPYIKIGSKVLYDVRDLVDFIERHRVRQIEPISRRSRRAALAIYRKSLKK